MVQSKGNCLERVLRSLVPGAFAGYLGCTSMSGELIVSCSLEAPSAMTLLPEHTFRY